MIKFDFGRSSSFKGPEDSPGYLLWRASTLWRRTIEAVLKKLDLTHPQFVILAGVAWLTRHGEMASQVEIGRQAGLDPNTTSQVLRSLQSKNLIERIQHQDERSKCPTLTSLGKKTLKKALPVVEEADAQFFASVNLHKLNAMEAMRRLARMK